MTGNGNRWYCRVPASKPAAISNEWYTLEGLRLDKAPTAKGIYIQNGRKVVIK